MKSTVEERILETPFLDVYGTIKERIVANGFLLLHEIDTKEIVSKHGVEIDPLKQLLFFEPKYIKHIMGNDYLAINDIPLKIVIKYLDSKTTSISFQNPVMNLGDYKLDYKVTNELMGRLNEIISL